MSVKTISFGEGDPVDTLTLEFHLRSELLRLENFLMEEFPGQLIDGDSFIHSAITIMRGMKERLDGYQASKKAEAPKQRFADLEIATR